ncbi:MAG: hypothetical protein VYC56_09410 [Actinomycetota bacterium]|nr:hypothetical protein [Actinomycetota bacterium]
METMRADSSAGSWRLAHDVWGPTEQSYWVVDLRLAAGAYPFSRDWSAGDPAPEVLHQALHAGIDVFVNLTQDDPEVHPQGTDVHLTRYQTVVAGQAEVLAHPIPDMGLPGGGEEEMAGILDAIDGVLVDGHNAYVHCWGGLGRTGTVVGCWLRRHGLAGQDEVLDVVQALRLAGCRVGGNRRTPQTPEQCWMVETWEEGR